MRTITWRAAIAVPAAFSLAFGAALLTAGSATAAPVAFTVLDPDSGTSLGVEQGTGDQILFQGVGLPAGDTVDVAYQDLGGVTHHGIVSDASVQHDGTWSQLDHLAELSVGQDHVTAVVTALKDGVGDPATTPQTDVFTIGALFAITSPADGATVDTDIPVFAGTAAILGRIRLTYVGFDGKRHVAADVDNGQSTTWSVPADFDELTAGATTVTVTAQYLGTSGNTVVNVPVRTETIHFVKAPVTLAKPGLSTLPAYPTLDVAKSVAGISFAGGGFTPGEKLDDTFTGPGGRVYAESGGVVHPTADAQGSFTNYTVLPASAPGGTYTITVSGETSHVSFSTSRDLVADPTITSPADHGTVTGDRFSITGTGTPGASVLLILGPSKTFQVHTLVSPGAATGAKSAAGAQADDPAAGPVPVSAGPIIVAPDGRWNSVFIGGSGDFTVQAYESQVVDGVPVNLSNPSAAVTFTRADANAATASTGSGSTLAFTGSQSTTPEAVAAALLMLIGTALTVAARRRRSGVK